jgi:hypothetical protein
MLSETWRNNSGGKDSSAYNLSNILGLMLVRMFVLVLHVLEYSTSIPQSLEDAND